MRSKFGQRFEIILDGCQSSNQAGWIIFEVATSYVSKTCMIFADGSAAPALYVDPQVMMLALGYSTASLPSCLTLIMVKKLLHDLISRILQQECWMAALVPSRTWLRKRIYKPPLYHELGSIAFRQALLDSLFPISRITSSELSVHAPCSHKA